MGVVVVVVVDTHKSVKICFGSGSGSAVGLINWP